MSKINMHPPQTYSRLFRPWDFTPNTCGARPTEHHTSANNTQDCIFLNRIIKNEGYNFTQHVSPAPAYAELNNRKLFDSSHESENECSSSSSLSSKPSSNEDNLNETLEVDGLSHSKISSNEENVNKTLHIDVSTPEDTPHLQNTMAAHSLPYDNKHIFGSVENQATYLAHQQTPTPPATLPYMLPVFPPVSPTGGLYYAAAAAAGLPTMPTTSPAAAAYALNPYGFGIVEQEYARVMAEDAHLKAANARKQRPKKFKCPHCEVAFSNNGQLKGHIRIHTGERPFKCDVESCGKTFTRNEELTRHKRIHTGLRPYPCTVCGKRFGRRDHLKKHMKTHMPQERELGPTIFLPMYPYLYRM